MLKVSTAYLVFLALKELREHKDLREHRVLKVPKAHQDFKVL